MKKSTASIIVAIVIIIIGVLWFVYGASPFQAPANSPEGQTSVLPTAPTPTITTGISDTLGAYLESSTNGMTLYTYQKDSPGVSNCVDACAIAWPPYTVSSADSVLSDPNLPGTPGTITRTDGTIQVTYNGLPLYFYNQDVNSGDTTGDGIGGAWLVAKP